MGISKKIIVGNPDETKSKIKKEIVMMNIDLTPKGTAFHQELIIVKQSWLLGWPPAI